MCEMLALDNSFSLLSHFLLSFFFFQRIYVAATYTALMNER